MMPYFSTAIGHGSGLTSEKMITSGAANLSVSLLFFHLWKE
jgi:hypothetical protein